MVSFLFHIFSVFLYKTIFSLENGHGSLSMVVPLVPLVPLVR